MLAKAGFTPTRVETTAKVYLEKVGEGFKITRINLDTVGQCRASPRRQFMEIAEAAKKGCPVSQLAHRRRNQPERPAGEVEQNVDGADSACQRSGQPF